MKRKLMALVLAALTALAVFAMPNVTAQAGGGPAVTVTGYGLNTSTMSMNSPIANPGKITDFTEYTVAPGLTATCLEFGYIYEDSTSTVFTYNGKKYSNAAGEYPDSDKVYAYLVSLECDSTADTLTVSIDGTLYTLNKTADAGTYICLIELGSPDAEGNLHPTGPVVTTTKAVFPTTLDPEEYFPEPFYMDADDYTIRADVPVVTFGFAWCVIDDDYGTINYDGKMYYVPEYDENPVPGEKYYYLVEVKCQSEFFADTVEVSINGTTYTAEKWELNKKFYYAAIPMGTLDEDGNLDKGPLLTMPELLVPAKLSDVGLDFTTSFPEATNVESSLYTWNSEVNGVRFMGGICYEDSENGPMELEGTKYSICANKAGNNKPVAGRNYFYLVMIMCDQTDDMRTVTVNGETVNVKNFGSVGDDTVYYGVIPIGTLDAEGNFGDAVKNGWVKEDDDWFYYEEGVSVKGDWRYLGGIWYWFKDNGVMLSDKIRKLEWKGTEAPYRFGKKGNMLKNCFAELDEGLPYYTYSDKHGTIYTGEGWKKINGKWYFFMYGADIGVSATLTGLIEDNGKTYYLDPENYNAMATGWVDVDGTEMYFNKYGARAKGWEKIEGKWYYFNDDGSETKKSCWFTDNGKDYYFDADGVMVTNTEVEGRKINKYGVAK